MVIGSRPRLQERQDKPDQHRHHDDPQKYNENNDGSNDYRSESFHHSLSLDYVHLPGTDQNCGRRTRRPGGNGCHRERVLVSQNGHRMVGVDPVPDSAELHSRLGEPTSHSHVICRRPGPRRRRGRRIAPNLSGMVAIRDDGAASGHCDRGHAWPGPARAYRFGTANSAGTPSVTASPAASKQRAPVSCLPGFWKIPLRCAGAGHDHLS
jgi:hypothetical protein